MNKVFSSRNALIEICKFLTTQDLRSFRCVCRSLYKLVSTESNILKCLLNREFPEVKVLGSINWECVEFVAEQKQKSYEYWKNSKKIIVGVIGCLGNLKVNSTVKGSLLHKSGLMGAFSSFMYTEEGPASICVLSVPKAEKAVAFLDCIDCWIVQGTNETCISGEVSVLQSFSIDNFFVILNASEANSEFLESQLGEKLLALSCLSDKSVITILEKVNKTYRARKLLETTEVPGVEVAKKKTCSLL